MAGRYEYPGGEVRMLRNEYKAIVVPGGKRGVEGQVE
jgi:hypothetical protein